MPAWVAPVLAIIGTVFGAGVTWGILSYRQKRTESTQTDLLKELRDCVNKLQSVVTEVEIMKVASARYERQSEEQDKRITALEITVAKFPRRKN